VKSLHLILFASWCSLSSCEKIRSLTGRLEKNPPATAAPTAHTGPLVTEIPDGGYDTFPLQSGKVVIVDFYAEWCGPCRQLAPILEDLTAKHKGSVVVGKVNIDQFRSLASKEGVRGIPDVRIYRDGKLVDKFVGLPADSEVRQRIETHVKGLPPPPTETASAGKSDASKPLTRPMTKDWLPPGVKRR
jgi:thioredoxin 1